MIMIRKPIGEPVGGGDIIYEEEVFFNPRRRPVSGSAFEDYEEAQELSGDREVFRIPYQVWLEGITAGSNWEVHVYETVNDRFVEQKLIQTQRIKGALELFVEIGATDIPKVEKLPPVLTVGGRPVTIGGREIRL